MPPTISAVDPRSHNHQATLDDGPPRGGTTATAATQANSSPLKARAPPPPQALSCKQASCPVKSWPSAASDGNVVRHDTCSHVCSVTRASADAIPNSATNTTATKRAAASQREEVVATAAQDTA